MSDIERRTLKTLQLSSNGKLIGSEKPPKSKIIVSKKPLKIFQDKNSVSSKQLKCEAETQTVVSQTETEAQTDVTGATGVSAPSSIRDAHNDSGAADLDQEAYDLMVRDPVPENYWRDLAEERRLSLAEALSENEMLHQSMEELKEENHNLSLLAGQAEHLASVLNDVLCDDEDKDSSGDKDSDSSEENSADIEPNTEEQTEQSEDEEDTKAVEKETQSTTEETKNLDENSDNATSEKP